MRLFHAAISSNARRVTLVAEHLGIPLDLVDVNLGSPDDRRRLAEVNPNGKIPVLADGDFVLWESCAIMQYLADKVDGHDLYPRDPQTRADVNRWMFWACQHWSPAIGILTWENVWKGMTGNGPADQAELARGDAEIDAAASVLERELAERRWLLGETLTLADFAIAPSLMYTVRARLPMDRYPNVMAWFARIEALPAWKHTEPVW
ncbi:MAG: glutathione S-transferase family protein [Massilia sp.]